MAGPPGPISIQRKITPHRRAGAPLQETGFALKAAELMFLDQLDRFALVVGLALQISYLVKAPGSQSSWQVGAAGIPRQRPQPACSFEAPNFHG
jgi:hypothetical protein